MFCKLLIVKYFYSKNTTSENPFRIKVVRNLTPRFILQTVKDSFKAVFSGEATPQQFIHAFFALASVALIILFFFILITGH